MLENIEEEVNLAHRDEDVEEFTEEETIGILVELVVNVFMIMMKKGVLFGFFVFNHPVWKHKIWFFLSNSRTRI